MAEVEAVTDQYRPLSQSCSSIYFTMESLNLVSEPSLCASLANLFFIESKSDFVYKIIFYQKVNSTLVELGLRPYVITALGEINFKRNKNIFIKKISSKIKDSHL